MSIAVSSSSLNLKNPLRPLGWARLVAAGGIACVVAISIGIAFVQSSSDSTRMVVIGRSALGIFFALSLAASGLRTLLAIVPQGDVPGPLKQGPTGATNLLEKKLIAGTYDQPRSLIGLMIYHMVPRFAFLTPPHRQVLHGIGIRLFWLTFSVAAAFFVGPATHWWTMILLTELMARWIAVVVAHPEQPATTGIRERRDHLGDKGDPAGLYHHLRHVCERFRAGDFPNRCLSDKAPHVSEQVRDARIEGEYFVETQPVPVDAPGKDGMVLAVAGVVLSLLGSGLLLLTPLAASLTAGSVVAMGSGAIGMAAAAASFRLAFICLAAMRFQSDLFLMRVRGTYNTTRVGAQYQRTSFQSDVYLDLFSARMISELAPGRGHLAAIGQLSDVLRSSRLVVTVLDEELLGGRMSELVHSAWNYQDQASSARPTDLTSQDYAQHLARLQAESFAAAQGAIQGHLTGQATAQPVLPSTNSHNALPAPAAGTMRPSVPLIPNPVSKPPVSPPPAVPSRPAVAPIKQSLPPPPPPPPPRKKP